MRFKSLIQAALGVCATILLAGCFNAYVNPEDGSSRSTAPSPNEVSYWQGRPGSFASRNRDVDFSKQAKYEGVQGPASGKDLWTPSLTLLPKPAVTSSESKPAVSSSSPTGTPGSSAAGAAATTSPMISSPPAPPLTPAPYRH
jgi:hypothetical protein